MLRIAVCDDDRSIVIMISSLIEHRLGNFNNITLCDYDSGESLLEKYQFDKYPFDIILLDVEMGGIDGIETAKMIREKDKDVVIVFFTAHDEYAIAGYDVKANKYILKTEPNEIIIGKLKNIIDDYKFDKKTLVINNKSETHAIKIDSIIYAEVLNRIVTIHTLSHNYTYYARLAELENQLSEFHFVRASKSYLINPAYIKSSEKDQLVFINDESIYISRKYKANVKYEFLNYILSRR